MRLCLGEKQGCREAVCAHLDVQNAGWGEETSALGSVELELGWL